jgi:hypothetical protein
VDNLLLPQSNIAGYSGTVDNQRLAEKRSNGHRLVNVQTTEIQPELCMSELCAGHDNRKQETIATWTINAHMAVSVIA